MGRTNQSTVISSPLVKKFIKDKDKNKLNLTKKFTLSTYNVRTLLQIGKFNELCTGCAKYDLDFIAVQEHRWQTECVYNKIYNNDNKYLFIYSSANKGQGGLGLLLKRKYESSIKSILRISERILSVSFNTNPTLTIVVIYAPTECAEEDAKTKTKILWDELGDYLSSLPAHNMVLV